MKVTRFNEHGQELHPGLRSTHQHNLTTPKFIIVTVLEAVEPDKWRAEVTLFDEIILNVPGTHPSSYAAGTAAETALREQLIRLFRVSD